MWQKIYVSMFIFKVSYEKAQETEFSHELLLQQSTQPLHNRDDKSSFTVNCESVITSSGFSAEQAYMSERHRDR